jgi:hypothetical protein
VRVEANALSDRLGNATDGRLDEEAG